MWLGLRGFSVRWSGVTGGDHEAGLLSKDPSGDNRVGCIRVGNEPVKRKGARRS